MSFSLIWHKTITHQILVVITVVIISSLLLCIWVYSACVKIFKKYFTFLEGIILDLEGILRGLLVRHYECIVVVVSKTQCCLFFQKQ